MIDKKALLFAWLGGFFCGISFTLLIIRILIAFYR